MARKSHSPKVPNICPVADTLCIDLCSVSLRQRLGHPPSGRPLCSPFQVNHLNCSHCFLLCSDAFCAEPSPIPPWHISMVHPFHSCHCFKPTPLWKYLGILHPEQFMLEEPHFPHVPEKYLLFCMLSHHCPCICLHNLPPLQPNTTFPFESHKPIGQTISLLTQVPFSSGSLCPFLLIARLSCDCRSFNLPMLILYGVFDTYLSCQWKKHWNTVDCRHYFGNIKISKAQSLTKNNSDS